jgi:hypothetical protein
VTQYIEVTLAVLDSFDIVVDAFLLACRELEAPDGIVVSASTDGAEPMRRGLKVKLSEYTAQAECSNRIETLPRPAFS